MWTWPDVIAEITCIAEVEKDQISGKLGRVVMGSEQGFMPESNLKELQEADVYDIVGEKICFGKS